MTSKTKQATISGSGVIAQGRRDPVVVKAQAAKNAQNAANPKKASKPAAKDKARGRS